METEVLRQAIVKALQSQPMLLGILKASRKYDTIIEYIPLAIIILLESEKGITVLKGLGLYELITENLL